jgi:transcriptional regulator with XRE-family HTH domain
LDVEHRSQTGLTDFGKYLYQVMVSRDLRTFADLSRALESRGHGVSRQAIANYANGNRAVPASFVVAVASELKLSEDEQRELAWCFAYGQ